MKKCNRCGIIKENSDFYKDSYKKDGLKTICKECGDKKYQDNKESNLKKERDRYAVYSKTDEYKKRKKLYYQKNKKRINENSKKWREDNLERQKDTSKKNYQKNKDLILSKYKERLYIDPLFKLIQNLRCNIRNSLTKTGYSKKTKTYDILGIDFNQFREYIENQFEEGMSWENYGEWHLDHKTPISWAKDESDAISLCHYTNYQPLWAFENISKGNKFKSE
jgi:hypothetical protein